VDPESGEWAHIQLAGEIVNPSFLALDRSKRFLYSVHGDMTYTTAFSIDGTTGRLSVPNQQDTGGRNPVHLALDPSGRFLVVADYSSGSVAVLPINPDGSLAPRSDLVALQGQPGPHPTEQTSSHPHHNPFDPRGRFFLVQPDASRLRADAGQHAALFRTRPVGHVAVCMQPGQRHCRHVPRRRRDGQSHADRPDSEDREPRDDRVQVEAITPAGSDGALRSSHSGTGRFFERRNSGLNSRDW
jgi:6-phosphogluconolactonase